MVSAEPHIDIRRAKDRASILADITTGEVTLAVITANLSEPQQVYADSEGVAIFTTPYSPDFTDGE